MIQAAADSLDSRFSSIERDFAFERERYLSAMSEKTAAVAKDLLGLQNQLTQERSLRSEKDSVFAQRISELEFKGESRFQREKSSVDARLGTLRESLVEYKRIRDQGDDKFQSFVLEEIATLKNAIVIESQSREQSDDDIVSALNHYTRALQDALRIVNSSFECLIPSPQRMTTVRLENLVDQCITIRSEDVRVRLTSRYFSVFWTIRLLTQS